MDVAAAAAAAAVLAGAAAIVLHRFVVRGPFARPGPFLRKRKSVYYRYIQLGIYVCTGNVSMSLIDYYCKIKNCEAKYGTLVSSFFASETSYVSILYVLSTYRHCMPMSEPACLCLHSEHR